MGWCPYLSLGVLPRVGGFHSMGLPEAFGQEQDMVAGISQMVMCGTGRCTGRHPCACQLNTPEVEAEVQGQSQPWFMVNLRQRWFKVEKGSFQFVALSSLLPESYVGSAKKERSEQ